MGTKSNFNILNEYFDKIIILTIERNKDRIKIIREVLQGLDFEIFVGADGAKLDFMSMLENGEISKDINNNFVNTSADYMNMKVDKIHINEIACALSHRNIYEYIIKKNFSRVLILEDDVIPVDKNLQYLPETLKQLPNNWEMLYLGHMINNDFTLWGKFKYSYLTSFLYTIGLKTKSIIRKKKSYPLDYSSLLKKQGGHTCTHAYAVTSDAASKLLALQKPISYVADLLLMDAIAKKIVVSYTSKYIFFEQNNTIHSSIWGK